MTRGNHQPSPETGHTRVRGRISQRAVLLGPTNSGRSERRLRPCPPRFETSTGGYRNPGFRPTLCLPGCLPLGPSNLSEPRFPQSRGIAAAQMRLEAVDAPRELQSPASGPVSGMAQVSGSSKVPLWSCRRHRRERCRLGRAPARGCRDPELGRFIFSENTPPTVTWGRASGA